MIVGTPGRVQEHLKKGTLKLDGLNTLVLDEADRMLDMGFYDAIAEIIGQTPAKRQTLLFSATYPASIEQLAASFMRAPQQVRVESLHTDSQIEQRFTRSTPSSVWMRWRACWPASARKAAWPSASPSSNARSWSSTSTPRASRQRHSMAIWSSVIGIRSWRCSQTAACRCWWLPMSPPAGWISTLDMVINVELARDPEIHVHRIGRTGRAGNQGLAASLVAPAEAHRAQAIEVAEVAAQLAFPGRAESRRGCAAATADGDAVHRCRAQGQAAPGRHPGA